MLEWASGGSERPFNQSAANGRKEPRVLDAAIRTNGSKRFEAAVQNDLATQNQPLAAI